MGKLIKGKFNSNQAYYNEVEAEFIKWHKKDKLINKVKFILLILFMALIGVFIYNISCLAL